MRTFLCVQHDDDALPGTNYQVHSLSLIHIFAAVAAGRERSGFGDVGEAVCALGKLSGDVYVPNPEAAAVYDRLFAEYREVHDFFGRGGSGVMHRLRAIRAEA